MVDKGLIERFNAKWEKDSKSDCWLWTASLAGKGYGQIKLPRERRQTYAHRVSYMIHHGEIPEGRQVCHTCDTPRCVNPAHLFVGTASDNLQDMKAKGRHLYGEKNVKARLTDNKVNEVLLLINRGFSQRKVALLFDVSQATISRICRGLSWSHVTNKEPH